MKKEEKRQGLAELKIWNYINIQRKRQKNHGFQTNQRFGLLSKDLKLYEYTQEKSEQSWVLGELKI